MLAEASSFIKKHFQRSENSLMQIILINALIFAALLLIKTALVLAGHEIYYQALYQFLSLPASWQSFLHQPWSIITHFWVHEHFFITIWSLLLLHAFGQPIMQSLGSQSLVALYVLGGIAGGVCFLLLYNLAPRFQGTSASLVGLTGSLYAVMVGAAIQIPDLAFRLLFLATIRIKYIVGFLLLLSFFELSSPQPAAGIANLGGALLGYIYTSHASKLVVLDTILVRLRKFFRKKSTLKVTYRRDKPMDPGNRDKPTDSDEEVHHIEQEAIDLILDKVAESGYESLSQEEKRQLFHAGK